MFIIQDEILVVKESPCMYRKVASFPLSTLPTAAGGLEVVWLRSRASLKVGSCIFFAGENCCESELRGKTSFCCVKKMEKLLLLKSCCSVKN